MTKFLVERTFHVGEADMPEVSRRSKKIAIDSYPMIVWEHSHVVEDTDGTLKSFCVYVAPSEDMVRRHAELLGNHVVDKVYEIGGDVTPADFPL